ncbi:serine protease [Palleronia caenipelagi]|nr:serine protease [Palleronia caenipelagi]
MVKRLLKVSLILLLTTPAMAEEVWLQIEAKRSQAEAIEAAQGYDAQIDGVAAYDLENSSWNAIVVGPVERAMAPALRRQLVAAGLIPKDAYAVDGANFGQQLWPVAGRGPSNAPSLGAASAGDPPPALGPAPGTVDETPAAARAGEARLDAETRVALQAALAWAGHYRGTLDGAFGEGTRSAMADWQQDSGLEPTGILTTRQRDQLLGAYKAVFDGLGMEMVEDDTAGVMLELPLGVLSAPRIAPPFVIYEPRENASPAATVLLISEAGGSSELRSLYAAMQTLEIVPETGPRSLEERNFVLTGENDEIVSHTEVRAQNGALKGFTLVWPAGDEDRRTRVLAQMQQSFATLPRKVLPPVTEAPGEPVDLLAGLEVRRPIFTRSGVYVGAQGEVLTALEQLDRCGHISLGSGVKVTVSHSDPDRGLALLLPETSQVPMATAKLAQAPLRPEQTAILAGYAFGGQLPAPTLTTGRLASLTGLAGSEQHERYALDARPGDAGGPVFAPSGALVATLQPRDDLPRRLPDQVNHATGIANIVGFLEASGISPERSRSDSALTITQLDRLAGQVTVLISCWE